MRRRSAHILDVLDSFREAIQATAYTSTQEITEYPLSCSVPGTQNRFRSRFFQPSVFRFQNFVK